LLEKKLKQKSSKVSDSESESLYSISATGVCTPSLDAMEADGDRLSSQSTEAVTADVTIDVDASEGESCDLTLSAWEEIGEVGYSYIHTITVGCKRRWHSFEKMNQVLGNQELAKMTGLPKPTIARITNTLVSLGYLKQLPNSTKYTLDIGVLSLGYAALSNISIRNIAHQYMEEMSQYVQAPVAMATRDRQVIMPFGTPGGDAQAQAMLQVFLNVVVFGMQIQEAFEEPRFISYSFPGSFEPPTLALRRRPQKTPPRVALTQCYWRPGARLTH